MIAPVKIAGIGHCVPERIVTNFDIEKLVDTSDEWITKRTGIRKRHIAVKETALDLGIAAVRQALAQAEVDKVDLIIGSTVTGDYLTPSLASLIQRELDIDCPCLDISAGCSGFVYSLVTAASMMDTVGADTALVVASEMLSRYANWSDRSTCVLFGDGAGAVILKRSDKPYVFYPVLAGVPDRDNAITIKKEERETPFYKPEQTKMEYLTMKGSEVFTYAVGVVEETLRKLQKLCGDKPFTKVIPHQANEKIIDYVRRKMRMKKEQFFINISEYANTSSATIPIALSDAFNKGWLKKGERVALVGFGSGLTSGGVVIDWAI